MNKHASDRHEAIRKAIKHQRTELGISARELSERMAVAGSKMDYPVLANLEAGRRRHIDIDDLFELADALGVPVSHICPGLEAPSVDRLSVVIDGKRFMTVSDG